MTALLLLLLKLLKLLAAMPADFWLLLLTMLAALPAAVLTSDPLLTREEAAEYIGVAPQTLAAWACLQRHDLTYIKVGRLVKYRKSDLDAWLEKNTVRGGE